MAHHYHYVVWLDHQAAHVIAFNADDAEASVVKPQSRHEHAKRGVGRGAGAPEDAAYFAAVAKALEPAGEILIVGPAATKLQFFKYLQKHTAATAEKVVAVETVDHPSDGELLKYARRQFVADDRMRPQA